MAYLYRQHRSQTHRHISNNSTIQIQQFDHKNVQKINNKILQNHLEIPVGYYFDKKQKIKVIKNMIQMYFEQTVNPDAAKQRDKMNQKQFVNINRDRHKITINNNKNKTIDSKNKSDILQNIKIKDMSQTVCAKFFSHRSFVESSNNNLPIIDQVFQHNNHIKRPQSQQKTRIISSFPLQRRQSAGISPRKQALQSANKSQISHKSQNLIDSQSQLGQSIILNKTISTISKNSTNSNKSYTKQCKYYILKYNNQKIVKNFNKEGMFLLNRQLKIKKYGAKTLCNASPYFNQLVLQKHKPLQKQLYYRIKKIHGQQTIQIIYPHENIYQQLFKNNSQNFRDIIIQLCKQLLVLQNKVIINKITIDNICRIGQKQIRIIDWSCVGLRESIVNLDKNVIVKITSPTLQQLALNNGDKKIDDKNKVGKWLCQPEYLAPQIIRSLAKQKLDDESLWINSSASDIWSLGCLIFQILTLIPFNAKQRHTIKGRTYNRRGIFYMPQFSYNELQRKQKLFSTQGIRIIKKQCSDILIKKIDNRILQVMQRMLVFDREKRIKPEEVIRILSK